MTPHLAPFNIALRGPSVEGVAASSVGPTGGGVGSVIRPGLCLRVDRGQFPMHFKGVVWRGAGLEP